LNQALTSKKPNMHSSKKCTHLSKLRFKKTEKRIMNTLKFKVRALLRPRETGPKNLTERLLVFLKKKKIKA